MATNRYKNAKTRTVRGELKILEMSDPRIKRVQIRALNDITNRNNWRYINLEQHLNSFRNIPILTAYINGGKKVGDGHNYDLKVDPNTGREYASFTAPDAERIVGWVPETADVHIEAENGVNWVVVDAGLWSWYSHELVEQIVRQGNNSPMEVSIETLILDEYMEGAVAVETSYEVLGITILGAGVMPAVAGANIKSLAQLTALRSSMKTEILKAASYIENEPNKNEKFEGVKSKMPNERQLKELSTSFSGYNCVGASEDGTKIALLSATNVPFGYAFEDSDAGNVITDRITAANATVSFRFNGVEVETDLENVLHALSERCEALEADKANLEKAHKDYEDKLNRMVANENSRRLMAANAAMTDELNKRNANRSDENKFSAAICADLEKRIANNEFTCMEDKDGMWTGEKAIRSEVSALCMDEQTRMDAEAKQREKGLHNWNLNSAGNPGDMTVGEKMRAGNN